MKTLIILLRFGPKAILALEALRSDLDPETRNRANRRLQRLLS